MTSHTTSWGYLSQVNTHLAPGQTQSQGNRTINEGDSLREPCSCSRERRFQEVPYFPFFPLGDFAFALHLALIHLIILIFNSISCF
jgi:hypothetical protein